MQTNVNYQASPKWDGVGNISQNKYQYQPTRETKFGTLDNPMALTVYYEGQEKINTTLILEL
jgi:hypothetical protein